MNTTGQSFSKYGNNSIYLNQANQAEEEARETLNILHEMQMILNCGLDKTQLSLIVSLCENGVNPEALAQVVRELKERSAQFQDSNQN